VTIEDLIVEALRARDRFWFIQEFQLKERTDMTVTLHFIIGKDLLVQVYYSQRSDRLSLTLVVSAGRLYGRDKEHDYWHLHPFGQAEQHVPTPEGVSLQPIHQFLAEVEMILIENDLI
jgi:hypothetical protein